MTANQYRFPVSGIHQIEITSRCNLRCKYCVHPKMPRAKEDMSRDTYVQTLNLARRLILARPGRQKELNLAGIGESTMHKEFVEFMFMAREAVGFGVDLILATNGLLMTKDLARAIAPTRPKVWVSLHRPERAGPAVEALRSAGILTGVSVDPSISAVDWAGQVDWQVSTPIKGTPCPWVTGGLAFALSDGRLARCCFDATADDIIGNVWDEPSALFTSPYSLCATCHLDVGVPLPQEAQVTHALNLAPAEKN